jgi:hypothetical protein
MTTKINDWHIEAERDTAQARSDVIRRAKAQGVQSFTSLEDFAGDAAMTADLDVDEFLHQVRKDRDRPSNPERE